MFNWYRQSINNVRHNKFKQNVPLRPYAMFTRTISSDTIANRHHLRINADRQVYSVLRKVNILEKTDSPHLY